MSGSSANESGMTAVSVVLLVLLFLSVLLNLGLVFIIFRVKHRTRKSSNDQEKPLALPPPAPVVQRSKEEDEKAKSKSTLKKIPKKDENAVPRNNKRSMSREEAMRSELDHAPPPEKMQRSERQKLMEPISRFEFSVAMNWIVKFVNDYFDESHKLAVLPENEPNAEKIQKSFPDYPEDCKVILEDLKHIIVPNMCHSQHPRYHAKFSGRSLADVLGSTISSALGTDVNSSPMIDVIERILCNWLSSAMGITKLRSLYGDKKEKDPMGTVFYSSVNCFTSLIQHCVYRAKSHNKTSVEFVVYCSDDAYFRLEEACKIMKIKLRKIITKKEDDYGITAKSFEKQVDKDIEKKLTPLLVVANYGSLNIGANDDFKAVAEVAKQKNIWIHVDAYYAGCQWIEPTKRTKIHAALLDVNSLHVCFSTMFPFNGRVIITWSSEKIIPENGPTLSSMFGGNSLRLWILIRLIGMRSLRESVKRKINFGNMFSDRIEQQSDYFRVSYPNDHGVVLFQYFNKTIKDRKIDANVLTSMFYNYMQQSAQMKFSLVKFHNDILIRACINYERCNASIMEESVSTLLNLVEDFEESMKKKKNMLKEATSFAFESQIGGSPNETTDRTPPSDHQDSKK